MLIYTDPPYLIETRTSKKRFKYDYALDDHKRLIGILTSIPAMVMISAYPSGLYEAWLKGWKRNEFQVMTRGGPRTEVLWMNFPVSGSHWATFAGANFTDRQRIKRKAARWAANYRSLPPGERTAVLAGDSGNASGSSIITAVYARARIDKGGYDASSIVRAVYGRGYRL